MGNSNSSEEKYDVQLETIYFSTLYHACNDIYETCKDDKCEIKSKIATKTKNICEYMKEYEQAKTHYDFSKTKKNFENLKQVWCSTRPRLFYFIGLLNEELKHMNDSEFVYLVENLQNFSDLQQHIINTLYNKHMHDSLETACYRKQLEARNDKEPPKPESKPKPS